MKTDHPNIPLSITKKFVILFLVLAFLAVVDSYMMLSKSRSMVAYNSLYERLVVLKSEVVKLEFLLDIVVVARDFEDSTGSSVEMGLEDIGKIVADFDDPDYSRLFDTVPAFVRARADINENVDLLVSRTSRLNSASTAEEVMLIHNDVDDITYDLTEEVNVFLSVLENERVIVEKEGLRLLFILLAFSVLFSIAACLYFIVRELMPLARLRHLVGDVTNGGRDSFDIDERLSGEAGVIAKSVSSFIDSIDAKLKAAGDEESKAKERLAAILKGVDSLNQVAVTVGKSLSRYEVFMQGLSGVIESTSAFAGAVYIEEDGRLKLQVSKGFSSTFFHSGENLSMTEMRSVGAYDNHEAVLKGLDRFPDGDFKSVLSSEGVGTLVIVPVLHGDSKEGFFLIAYENTTLFSEDDVGLLKAVASNLGVGVGYAKLFYDEHARMRFLESIAEQSPQAIAVFNKEGICVFANIEARKYLGFGNDVQSVQNYSLMNDDVLKAQGHLDSVFESFDGRTYEFVTEYSLRSVDKYGTRSLRVRSLPLFDASGSIPNIMLAYEDVSDDVPSSKGGESLPETEPGAGGQG
jgi:PAS domain-containing protein